MWSPIEYLAHVVDVVHWYRERITTVLGHEGVRLKPFDGDEACTQRRYNEPFWHSYAAPPCEPKWDGTKLDAWATSVIVEHLLIKEEQVSGKIPVGSAA